MASNWLSEPPRLCPVMSIDTPFLVSFARSLSNVAIVPWTVRVWLLA